MVKSGFANVNVLKTDAAFASLQSDAHFQKVVESAQKNLTPCKFAPEYRQFDFWVGEWDVTWNGKQAGTSSIQGDVNISSGNAITVRSLVEKIGALTGGADLVRFGAVPSPRFDPPLIEGVSGRLNEEVGYLPRWNLDEGLEDAVADYRAARA